MRAEFGVEETHGILWRKQNRRQASSKGRGWTSLFAAIQDEAPYEAAFLGVADHLLILHLGAPVTVARRVGGSLLERTVPTGGIFFMPGNTDFWVRLGGELQTLHLYLRHALFADVAADLYAGDPAHIALPPMLGEADAPIARLAHNFRDALADPAGGDGLYADHLGRALAAHLLRRRTGAPGRELSPPRRRAQIDRAVDFIHANLADRLEIEDLAAASALSPTHFTREFRRAIGLPPHQFVLRCRVRRARELLARTKIPIAGIALDCGFATQEHFTRVFAAQTGTTPAAFRRLSA